MDEKRDDEKREDMKKIVKVWRRLSWEKGVLTKEKMWFDVNSYLKMSLVVWETRRQAINVMNEEEGKGFSRRNHLKDQDISSWGLHDIFRDIAREQLILHARSLFEELSLDAVKQIWLFHLWWQLREFILVIEKDLNKQEDQQIDSQTKVFSLWGRKTINPGQKARLRSRCREHQEISSL